jgi:uncharacterized protein (DUF305 family)
MDMSSHNSHNSHNMESSNDLLSNPCTDKLTDIEYLDHMIPHHQVAIDMSVMLQPRTSSDIMLNLCREIIRKQSYEIFEMEKMKKYTGDLFSKDPWVKEKVVTKLDRFNPVMSKSADGTCNPLFFKPNDHSKMMDGMVISDEGYLEHMIPHHQVAVDMSKRLLLHTNNSYLLDFCRKLILDQQGEIYYMNHLLVNAGSLYKSELLSS